MIIKQLSVFVQNKVGRMAEITQAIGDAGVDIRALSIADTSDFGILRLIVNKPEQAAESLQKAGMMVSLTDVIGVSVADEPGAFAKTLRILSDSGADIEYMYAFVSRINGAAFAILRVEDPEAGINTLRSAGVSILTTDELYNI